MTPTGAKLAYQFKMNIKDTLRGVQMYFNRTMNNANEVFFDLMGVFAHLPDGFKLIMDQVHWLRRVV